MTIRVTDAAGAAELLITSRLTYFDSTVNAGNGHWHKFRRIAALNSRAYFNVQLIGGIAQWQSIRLQIERSPVQLRLPPVVCFTVVLTQTASLLNHLKPLLCYDQNLCSCKIE